MPLPFAVLAFAIASRTSLFGAPEPPLDLPPAIVDVSVIAHIVLRSCGDVGIQEQVYELHGILFYTQALSRVCTQRISLNGCNT